MADISNKFLVFLLVIAILVIAIGTWYSIDRINKFAVLTGFGTTGTVSINITERVEINVTQPACVFGSGYVTPPYTYAILNPGATNGNCGTIDTKSNWTNTTTYNPDCMIVRNDGNVNVSVNVSSGKTAAQFIGGTNPNVTVWTKSKEYSVANQACGDETGFAGINYPGKEMDTSNITICTKLQPIDEYDEMYVGCHLMIPNDAVGEKSDSWTVYAVAI